MHAAGADPHLLGDCPYPQALLPQVAYALHRVSPEMFHLSLFCVHLKHLDTRAWDTPGNYNLEHLKTMAWNTWNTPRNYDRLGSTRL